MLKVVLMGCGLIADSHASAVKRIDGVELAGACDINREAAERIAGTYGCRAYTDGERMLEETNPDICIICVPTFLHEEYVRMCARRQVHVLCEKPLERTVESGGRLIEEVKKAGIIFMTAQVVRFWSGYVEIKKMMEEGGLGDIYMMHLRRVSSRAGQYGQWLFKPELGGGAMYDMLVHDVDYLRYAAGPFESCYANAVKDETGCYNNVMANMVHKNGIHSLAEVSFTMQTGYPFSFSVHIVGAKATLEYSYSAGATIADRSSSKTEMRIWRKETGMEVCALKDYDAYEAQLRYFTDCVKEGKKPDIITPEESHEVITMIDALYRSAQENRMIRL